jgi:hypothetical protein
LVHSNIFLVIFGSPKNKILQRMVVHFVEDHIRGADQLMLSKPELVARRVSRPTVEVLG